MRKLVAGHLQKHDSAHRQCSKRAWKRARAPCLASLFALAICAALACQQMKQRALVLR